MGTFAPTPEQENARAIFATRSSMVVEAGAGTGKTSTLILLAEDAEREHRRGLYVAFNKAIATEAASKMPENVSCSTAHSLAYRAVAAGAAGPGWDGRTLQTRLRSKRQSGDEVARILRIDPFITTDAEGGGRRLAPGFLAGLVQRGVERFCQSDAPTIGLEHLPYVEGIDFPLPDGRTGWANNRELRRHLLPAMQRAWVDAADPRGSLRFTHSHYLKLWHLSNPYITTDFILFDEAQDANPVLRSVVEMQGDHAQLVFVGDSQQAIYEFTGAVNALAELDTDQRAFLTQSFRFGPAVAEAANRILGILDADLRLEGLPTIDSEVAPLADPDALLCRTNAGAVEVLLGCLEAGRKPHLVGGAADVVAFAKGIIDLTERGYSSHPELACFASWGELVDYVDNDEMGGDLRLLTRLVDKFGAAEIIAALDETVSEDRADLVISTAHKSKGREWDRVKLHSDFAAPRPDSEIPGAEFRLLYVAVTRAKLVLDPYAAWPFSDDSEDDDGPAFEAIDSDSLRWLDGVDEARS